MTRDGMRIGIVMRSEVWREGLGLLLSSFKGIGGPSSPITMERGSSLFLDPSEAYDVLILDEEAWGIADAARSAYPACGLLLLTHMVQLSMIPRVFSADAKGKGYILWGDMTSSQRLVDDLTGLRLGRCIMSPSISEAYIPSIYNKGGYHQRLSKYLTPREIDVLRLMSEGNKNAAIASILYIQPRTVEHHINSILGKMGIDGRGEEVHPRIEAVLLYLNNQIHTEEESSVLSGSLA